MADRRKLTDSDIITDEKLLRLVEAVGDRPASSRHSAATVMQCLQNDDGAVDVLLTGDRGLFLLH
jgi:hypothetical protein